VKTPTGLARGAIDSGAALAALWYSEEECNDPFAVHVAAAIRSMLRTDKRIPWKVEPIEPISGVLKGSGTSPSVVWHAQAVGALLELGFHPSADCVRHHLLVLRERLRPENAHDPGAARGKRDHWVLRTRHVAWILACLAEMRHIAPREARTQEERAGISLHLDVLHTAYRYLIVPPARHELPWLTRRREDEGWTEYWGGRGVNLLNTLYTLLGLCRADRHGFGLAHPPYSLEASDVETLILDRLSIEPSSQGLAVYLTGDWNAAWTTEPLPSGVIGLIVLVLVEYAALLNEQARFEQTAGKAAAVQLTAQRLARHLSATIDQWWAHADAFLNTYAEGTWFVPSYSVCVRAMLDSGAVDPGASVVARAFTTISSGYGSVRSNVRGIETWADITRGFKPTQQQKKHGHALVPVPVRRGSRLVVTPAGLHAAVLAHTALRRALAREDPRSIVKRLAIEKPRGARAGTRAGAARRQFPTSPFSVLRIQPAGEKFVGIVSCPEIDPTYTEHAALGSAHCELLRALAAASTPMTLSELVDAMRARGWTRSFESRSVASAIDEINKRYAMRLIAGSKGSESRFVYKLTARLEEVADNGGGGQVRRRTSSPKRSSPLGR